MLEKTGGNATTHLKSYDVATNCDHFARTI